nr:hypothetical protein [Mucispirillum sp.]
LFNHLDDDGKEMFNLFIDGIENFFPYKDVYARLAKQQDCIEINTIEEDKLYQVLRIHIDELNNDDKLHFIKELEKNELLINQSNIINRLRESL